MAGSDTSTATGPGPPQIFCSTHCLFCLQPVSKSVLELVLKINPKGLKCFQPVLHYLTGTDPSHDRGREDREREGVPVMDNPPPMCQACYEVMAELHKLHQQLLEVQWRIQRQTEVARGIVVRAVIPQPPEFRESARQQFSGTMGAYGGKLKERAGAVVKFVDGFHNKIMAEVAAKRKLIFPSGFPPNFVPEPGSSTSQSQARSANANINLDFTAPIRVIQLPSTVPPIRSYSSDTEPIPMQEDSTDNDDIQLVEELPITPQPTSNPKPGPSSAEATPTPTRATVTAIATRSISLAPRADPHPPTKPYIRPGPRPTVFVPLEISSQSQSQPKRSLQLVFNANTKRFEYRYPLGRKLKKKRDPICRCDLCGEKMFGSKLVPHLESHGVGDFIVKCPSPKCPLSFSCHPKLQIHLYRRESMPTSLCVQAAGLPVGPLVWKCDICDFSATHTSGSFLKHIHTHEYAIEEKSLCCPISGCSEKFALRQTLERHLFTHDLRQPKTEQECTVCKEVVKLEEMSKHLQDLHQVEEVIPCRRCPFLFHSRENLLDHLYEHRGSFHSCDLCPENTIKFERYESLRQHYFNVHQIGKQYLCEHCDREYFSLVALSSHKSLHHSNSGPRPQQQQQNRKKEIKCDLCSFTALHIYPGRMQDHKIQMHGAHPIKCRVCDETFTSTSKVKLHEKTHTGLKRTYKCNVEGCLKACSSKTALTKHKLGVHSNSRPFVCDICGKAFNYSHSLKKHKDIVHLGQRERVICEVCGESFAGSNPLKHHMLIHTGERPHICPICGQAFRQRDVMRTHIKAHEKKGSEFKPKGAWQRNRKRVVRKTANDTDN